MKKIAFYGKGGIGKSTTAANVSAALSTAGHKVCQIGCDPKNDSTRLLLGHICKNTVLDMVRIKDEINLEDIVHYGFNGIKCVEAGGPEPGVGCAGRGIIVALEKLQELDAAADEDIILYDVLGDVVCGGFAVPIREGYATDIYVVVIVGALLYYCFNIGSKSEDVSAAAGETYKLEYTPTLQAYGFTEPVILKAKPQRVVSLVHTPVLALHEMDIKQVAVPQAAMLEWPADLVKDAKLLNVSMNSNFDIESVIALEPDLVIVGYQSKDTYGKILDREKIPVYYVDAGHVVSYESIKELTDVLIKAFGQHNAGAEAITDRFNKLEARMAEKRQENKGQKVMVLQSAPPRHYIQGKDGTLGSMLDMLGYENVYQNNKMVLIDLEQALSYEPDLLFCVGGSKTAAEHQQVMEEDFAKNPEYWNNIKAIREHEVIYLPIKYVATAGINVIDNINELIDIIDAKKLKQNG